MNAEKRKTLMILLVLAVLFPMAAAKADVRELLALAAECDTLDAQAKFLTIVQAKSETHVTGFVQAALAADDETVRHMGAVAAASVASNDVIRDLWRMYRDDKSRRIRLALFQSVLTRDVSVLEKTEFDSALEGDDVLVRAMAASVLNQRQIPRLVGQIRCDGSAFVRATAVRRLGLIWRDGHVEPSNQVKTALIAALVDQNQLVRSSALLVASKTKHLPLDLGQGLVLDHRSMLSIEEVLTLGDEESRLLRAQYDIDHEPLVNYRASRQIAKTVVSLIPSPDLAITVVPLNDSRRIGSFAMAVMLSVDATAYSKQQLWWNAIHDVDPGLELQLKDVLARGMPASDN